MELINREEDTTKDEDDQVIFPQTLYHFVLLYKEKPIGVIKFDHQYGDTSCEVIIVISNRYKRKG